ncbi:MAG: hypothetical protein ACYSXF_02560 [Planctomycetota bacterium]|jgi:hypothetical protein
MITLEGRFELDEYWKEVQQLGNDRLKDFGFDDWVVTVRPLTAAERAAGEAESVINISGATKTLDIVVDEQPELPAESFVQTGIIDVIDQVISALGDDDAEDWLRDEGGEA